MAADAWDPDEGLGLYIGASFGGPEFSHQPDVPWKTAIQELYRRVVVIREGVVSSLNLNVVFHVPGSLITPEFEGIRTSSFRRRDSVLMVQVALPAAVPEDQLAYLKHMVRETLPVVEQWNERKDRRFDLSILRSVIDRL